MDIWSGLYSTSLYHDGQGDWEMDTALWTFYVYSVTNTLWHPSQIKCPGNQGVCGDSFIRSISII